MTLNDDYSPLKETRYGFKRRLLDMTLNDDYPPLKETRYDFNDAYYKNRVLGGSIWVNEKLLSNRSLKRLVYEWMKIIIT